MRNPGKIGIWERASRWITAELDYKQIGRVTRQHYSAPQPCMKLCLQLLLPL